MGALRPVGDACGFFTHSSSRRTNLAEPIFIPPRGEQAIHECQKSPVCDSDVIRNQDPISSVPLGHCHVLRWAGDPSQLPRYSCSISEKCTD